MQVVTNRFFYVNISPMNDREPTHCLTLEMSHARQRLDAVLSKLFTEYSRSQLQGWIKSGHVLVNNQKVKPNYTIQGGETVLIQAQARPTLSSKAQAIPLHLIHEEDDFLIINKPAGLVVHPGAGNAESTLMNALLHHSPALKQLPRAGILHRLDKDTSGLLIVAKTDSALNNLLRKMKNREISREYQAIAHGHLISGGTVDAPLGRHPRDRKRMAVVPDGKPAVTHYRVIERFRFHTLLRIKLETGRTHQIRVHLAHIKYPIVGDKTYSGRPKLGKGMSPLLIEFIRHFHRQALHACAIEFDHPSTGERVRYESELPDDFSQLLTVLRKDKLANGS